MNWGEGMTTTSVGSVSSLGDDSKESEWGVVVAVTVASGIVEDEDVVAVIGVD